MTEVYSIFILFDDGTWKQPSFRIDAGGIRLTPSEIKKTAECHYGGFAAYGLCEDPEAKEYETIYLEI